MKELEKLKILIKAELDLCNKDKTPTVCSLSSDSDEYPKLEQMIIDRISIEGLSISQAIVEIERTYNPNLIQD